MMEDFRFSACPPEEFPGAPAAWYSGLGLGLGLAEQTGPVQAICRDVRMRLALAAKGGSAK